MSNSLSPSGVRVASLSGALIVSPSDAGVALHCRLGTGTSFARTLGPLPEEAGRGRTQPGAGPARVRVGRRAAARA
jgi:hypothetical protein